MDGPSLSNTADTTLINPKSESYNPTYGSMSGSSAIASQGWCKLRREIKDHGALRLFEDKNNTPLPWFVNPHVWWRHPMLRILNAWLILALDFWIYFEDPVNESYVEYTHNGFGQIYTLVVSWGEENCMLRGTILIGAIVVAMYIGQEWHNRVLRDFLGLSAFTETKGLIFVKIGFLPATLYIGSHVYNLCVTGTLYAPIDAQTNVPFHGISTFFQYFSCFLDVLTIVQVTDMVLQDRQVYPKWAANTKVVWNDTYGGWFRVVAAWGLGGALLGVLYFCIYAFEDAVFNDGPSIEVGSLNGCHGLNAFQRCLICCLIIFCDLLQVSQDWEFPTFDKPTQMMVAGSFDTDIRMDCFSTFLESVFTVFGFIPSWVSELFNIHVDGAWMIYGPLFASLLADLCCAKTQFSYVPANYGQYKDNVTDRVWNIVDTAYLDLAFHDGVLLIPDMISFDARWNASAATYNETSVSTDTFLNTHWVDCPYKWTAVMPGVVAILMFLYIVWGGETYWQSSISLSKKIANVSSSFHDILRTATDSSSWQVASKQMQKSILVTGKAQPTYQSEDTDALPEPKPENV